MLIRGKDIQKEIFDNIRKEVESLPFVPVFTDVMVGDDMVQALYVKMKEDTAKSVGFDVIETRFPSDAKTEQVVEKIRELCRKPEMCGVIVQLPLPEHIDREVVTRAIDMELDVDCLNTDNSTRFFKGEDVLVYPTARAIIEILDSKKLLSLEKKILVLGRGELVGKPVEYLLRSVGYDVRAIGRDVVDLKSETIEADIIISATGVPGILTGEMIKDGAIVIDAGTSESYGAVVGDVDRVSVESKASYLAAVPGGVGPVTIACLFKNVLEVAKKKSASWKQD